MLLVALPLVAFAESPPESCTVDALRSAQVDGVAAFAAMDPRALDAAHVRADATLACIDAPLTPELSATQHLLQGLWSYHALEREAAAQAFAAARRLSPDLRLPAEFAPAGGDLYLLFMGATPQEKAVDLPVVGEGEQWWVDGTATALLPTNSAVVLQLDSSEVFKSAYQWPGASLPSWAYAPAPVQPVVVPVPRSARIGKALAMGAGATGLASAACWGLGTFTAYRLDQAGISYASTGNLPDFLDPTVTGMPPGERRDQLGAQARRLGYAGQVGAGLTLGLAVSSTVVLSR